MNAVFIKLLNMSITASYIVLAVILLRFLLKKAPKWIMGVLWGFVAFRLICPFSLKSIFSLIPSAEPIPQNITVSENPSVNSALPIIDRAVNPIISGALAPNIENSVNPMQIIASVASAIWIIGITAMLLYTLISYVRIRRKVREAVPLRENIWICDRISTPFILGIIRPRIYLPSSMNKADMQYVISHEKAHLKRKDHIWKPFGFLLLSVYWFNPILWVAYILLCRDIELACDEKVIRQFGTEIKKPYSNALINCSMPRKMISACPLAFGETSVKERVKGVLNYKKPAFWIIVAAVAVCVITAVCLLTNPKGKIEKLNGSNYSVSKYYYSDVITTDKADRLSADEKFAVDESFNLYHFNGDGWFYSGKLKMQSDTKELEKLIKTQLPIYYQAISFDKIYATSDDSADVFAIMNNGDIIHACISYYQSQNPGKIISIAKLKYDGAFESKTVEKITSGFFVVDKGSDIEGVSLSIKAVDLDSEKPYIQVEWKNDSKNEVTFGEDFDIRYYKDGDRISCATSALYFDLVANILSAKGSRIKTYDISLFDLSKDGRYRFQVEHTKGVYSWIDFEIVSAQEANVGGTDEPNKIIVNPLGYPLGYYYSSGKDHASLSLEPKSKKFSFAFSLLSSYFATGTYEENDGYIVAHTDDDQYTYTFKKVGQGLTFAADKSSQMPSFAYSSGAKAEVCVPDGAVFQPTESKDAQLGTNPFFNAEVLEVSAGRILVKPDSDSNEIKSADKISVSLDVISTIPVPAVKVGDRVRVIYNGEIAETYPVQINKAFVIYLLSDDGKVLSPTPAK